MTDNVISLADKMNDGTLRDVRGALDDVLKRVIDGKEKANKVLILLLNDEGDNYHTGFYQAGMRCSEMIALAEASKLMFFEEMGIINK